MSDDVVSRTRRLGFPWETQDPFLVCVHHQDDYPPGNDRMGPAASLAGRELGMDFAGKDGWRMYHGETVPGFPGHPHRGFETVTIVRRGLIDHADSVGAAARYGGGDVQWLTAGRGIVHSEMFPLLDDERGNPLELFQLWLNLPRADKLVDPHFSMFWRDEIPTVEARDAAGRSTRITLVAGSLGDARPPAPPPSSWAGRPDSDVAIWLIRIAPGGRWTLPEARAGISRTLYLFRGDGVRVGGRDVPGGHAADLKPDFQVQMEAGPHECELLLLQGRPIAEPVAQHGPFVMSTRAELQQAFLDYQRTRFGGWPWPTEEPVHPRGEGRFARHADGRVERPQDGQSSSIVVP